jgi:type IV pilus assembly protein PilA
MAADHQPIRRDHGFTLVELLIVVAIISILAALATAGLLRSRMTANEVGAIASMRVVATAQKVYATSCGGGAYATTFIVLGTPPGGGQSFISADLGSSLTPSKSGYNFLLAPGAGSVAGPSDCHGQATNSAFYATATPMATTTGTRAFAVNGTSTVWQMQGLVAPAEPFGLPATPLR